MDASRAALALGLVVAAEGVACGQATERVSVDSSGTEGDDNSAAPSLSADGRIVAFWSAASNLVAGDTNGCQDVFVRDRSSGTTELASVDSAGLRGDLNSSSPALSADGRIVAFQSFATNLVAGDSNGTSDLFVHDRSIGTTERVSVDSSGLQGNGLSYDAAISSDGRIVAFASFAGNLVANDLNGVGDVFVHDRATGVTELVSVDSSGIAGSGSSEHPALSADGRYVAFVSVAPNLVVGDSNGARDVFLHDRSSGLTERVSLNSAGVEAFGGSYRVDLSDDGSLVVFSSDASNLVAGDSNGARDVFVHDRANGQTARVSVDSAGAEGNGASYEVASISADGRFVAFSSLASNLVAGDSNGAYDVFLHDRNGGRTDRISVDATGAEGDLASFDSSISADGGATAFDSAAANLVAGDTNGAADVFVRPHVFASSSNYGAGLPGTHGVPSFTSQSEPLLGTTVTLDLNNSYGVATGGVLFVGFQRTVIGSGFGGDLLVVPVLTLPIAIPVSGTSFSGLLPDTPDLVGVLVDLQVFEADPGAIDGVSFTAGLELLLGH